MKRSPLLSLLSHAAVSAALLAIAALSACSDNPAAQPQDAGADASIPTGDAGIVGLGKLFVQQRGCADCHQSADPKDGELTGQTTPRPFTKAYPSNLTPDPDTGIDAWTDEQYIRAIRDGVDDEGEDLCPTMPRFSQMGDDEGRAIAAYLRSLPPTHRAIPESFCPPVKPAPDAGAPDAGDDAQTDAAQDAGIADANDSG